MTKITPKSEDISAWYNDVVREAKLADHGPAKGTIIIRPLGYALWENIQEAMDIKIKGFGAQNAYFPLFIPHSFLEKEKDHVKGFSPELAIVTHAGGEKLAEPLVVRPTSETIMYDSFSKWISSYRDLPLKINQWNNVVRWEKRPYLFLRTTEFLWQEGHTAHATATEAQEMVDEALQMYIEIYQQNLALFGYAGKKSESEKFAGADATYTYELLMPDGKVLQGCTSHNLGQNFAKVFKVQFQNQNKQLEYVHQTSWGYTTRSIGALILAHGDDNGLVLPPKVAPTQVVLIPIISKNVDEDQIFGLAQQVYENLESADIRVYWDKSDSSPGYKFNQYELEGVPIRLEVGAREVENREVKLVRRDNKLSLVVKVDEVSSEVQTQLNQIQADLLEKSKTFTIENTREAQNYDEFKEIMSTTRGFIKAFWCEDPRCEEYIKNETKASTRCLPVGSLKLKGSCVYCGNSSTYQWLFGQSY